ncbi:MAG: MBL fold metallo-hydrolase [Minicystis sp.]
MALTAFYFLDVGQGDGTLIVFPNGATMLVDLGSKKNQKSAGLDAVGTVKTVLDTYCNKTRKIDYLVLTHGDGDHINLLPDLVDKEGFSFGQVYYGGKLGDYSSDVQTKVIKPAKVTYFYNKAYKKNLLSIGGVDVHVLAANASTWGDDKNANSVVLMFEYAKRRVILCGDAEQETEEFILKNFSSHFLKADVLKLAHHGSSSTNHEDWLKTVQPRIVTASGDQKWGHPYKDTLERVKSCTKLGTIFKHQWVSGTYVSKKQDYDWEVSQGTEAILTNIYDIAGSMGTSWQACGVGYGVYLVDDGRIFVGDTLNNEAEAQVR